jgi:NADH-quinone oxidoreductase subunit J
MNPRELLFWADAIVAVMTAGMVILHRNSVVCALSLVLHLCSVAFFFLLLDASFLFAVQIILYAGAIMVLFLFVVMLLDPAGEGVAGRTGRIHLGIAIAGAAALLAAVAKLLPSLPGGRGQPGSPLPAGFGQVASVGRLLFTDYLFPFEVASILLLVAMIGALYMGKRETD